MNKFKVNNLLCSFLEHETIKVTDLTESINSVDQSGNGSLLSYLDELCDMGFILKLDGVIPATYTITEAGIKESNTFK